MAKAGTVAGRALGVPKAAAQYVKESREELKKVSWPDRETTIRFTIIVVVASLAVGLLIGSIDYLFSLFIEAIISRS